MKKYLLLLIFAITACTKAVPFTVPQFSSFEFTGNAYSSELPMPIQGALTNKDNALKFVVAARQGVMLGYGSINPRTGRADIIFAQSTGLKKLLQAMGDSLIDLMVMLDGDKTSSKYWIMESGGKMVYKSPHLELSGQLHGGEK